MDNLFHDIDEARREQLRHRGCHKAGGQAQGCLLWRLPTGGVVDEDEAFAWLERKLKAEGKTDA